MMPRWIAHFIYVLLFSLTTQLESFRYAPYFEGFVCPTNRRVVYGGEVFLPAWQRENRLLFMDGRALFDSRDEFEANIGLGYRQLLFCDRAIIGVNVFGDFHRTESGSSFKQISFGGEWLTQYFELRGNLYIPEDSPNTVESITIPEEVLGVFPIMHYVDVNKIPETKDRKRERALSGCDLELGLRLPMPFCWSNVDLMVYGGWYRYNGKHSDTINGGRGRVELQVYDPCRSLGLMGTRLTLEAGFRSDNVRKGESYFCLRFALPLYESLASPFPCGLKRQMSHRIVRHEQVVVEKYFDKSDRTPISERLKNPNGQDLRIIYVDGTQSAFGEGTVENPYGFLSEGLGDLTEDYDILYITGDSDAGLGEGSFLVPPGIPHLRIVGAGVPFEVEGFTLFPEGTRPIVSGITSEPYVLSISETRDLLLEGFDLFGDADEPYLLFGKFENPNYRSNLILKEMGIVGNLSPDTTGIDLYYNNGRTNTLFLDKTLVGSRTTDQSLGDGIRIFNDHGTLETTLFRTDFKLLSDTGMSVLNKDKFLFFVNQSLFENCLVGGLFVENVEGAYMDILIDESVFQLNQFGATLIASGGSQVEGLLLNSSFKDNTMYGLGATATGFESQIELVAEGIEVLSNDFNGLQLNALMSGTVKFFSFMSQYLGNGSDDILVFASMKDVSPLACLLGTGNDAYALLDLVGCNEVGRVVLYADQDGDVEAIRTESDQVAETVTMIFGNGNVTTDPSPFDNP